MAEMLTLFITRLTSLKEKKISSGGANHIFSN